MRNSDGKILKRKFGHAVGLSGVYRRRTASAITPAAAAFGGGGKGWDFEPSYEIQLISRQVLYGPRVRVIVKVRIMV